MDARDEARKLTQNLEAKGEDMPVLNALAGLHTGTNALFEYLNERIKNGKTIIDLGSEEVRNIMGMLLVRNDYAHNVLVVKVISTVVADAANVRVVNADRKHMN